MFSGFHLSLSVLHGTQENNKQSCSFRQIDVLSIMVIIYTITYFHLDALYFTYSNRMFLNCIMPFITISLHNFLIVKGIFYHWSDCVLLLWCYAQWNSCCISNVTEVTAFYYAQWIHFLLCIRIAMRQITFIMYVSLPSLCLLIHLP